jgi:hypothetical protein
LLLIIFPTAVGCLHPLLGPLQLILPSSAVFYGNWLQGLCHTVYDHVNGDVSRARRLPRVCLAAAKICYQGYPDKEAALNLVSRSTI